MEEIRSEFEKWYSEEGSWTAAIARSGDGYLLMQTQQAWIAWQAAYLVYLNWVTKQD